MQSLETKFLFQSCCRSYYSKFWLTTHLLGTEQLWTNQKHQRHTIQRWKIQINDVWCAFWHFRNGKGKNGESVQISSVHRLLQDDEQFFRNKILPDDRLKIMKAIFSTASDDNLQLFKQKCYYSYSYVTGRWKFSDTSLPPLTKWGNNLDGGQWRQRSPIYNMQTCTQDVGYSGMRNTARPSWLILEARLCNNRMCLRILSRVEFRYVWTGPYALLHSIHFSSGSIP